MRNRISIAIYMYGQGEALFVHTISCCEGVGSLQGLSICEARFLVSIFRKSQPHSPGLIGLEFPQNLQSEIIGFSIDESTNRGVMMDRHA